MAAHAIAAQALQCIQDLSASALRDVAGNTVFARGEAYASSDAVQVLEDLPAAPDYVLGVRATVQGTQAYETALWWQAEDGLTGVCDCPHANDGFFCKHQVALALVWSARLGGPALEANPAAQKKLQAAAKRAKTQADKQAALHAFVQAQSAADLAQRLWRLAEQDRTVMAQLKAWHSQTMAQQALALGDVAAVQTAIRDVLKNSKGYLEPRDCLAYQRRAEQAFPWIQAVLQRAPSQARVLCEDMLARVFKVGATADDSWGGEIGHLAQSVVELLKICLQAEQPPVAWLKRWLSLTEKDPWGLHDSFAVMQAAGPALVQAYSQHLAHDWQLWQARNPGPHTRWNAERDAKRSAYLQDLARLGDDAGALEVMRQSAATEQEWLALVQWCKTKKRWREAFDFASKAYKLFPNDEGVQLAMLDAYERDGWDAEALVLHRLRLERNPSAQHYLATLAAATRAGQDRGLYRQSLLDWAQRKEPTTERLYGPAGGTVSYLDVSVRVRWYVEAEQDAQAALGLLQLPGTRCDARLLLALARQLPRTHDEAAREIFVRLLDEDMEGAVTPYAEALSLVQQALERMTTTQRAQWLSSLRTQYKAKRNFIKELPLA